MDKSLIISKIKSHYNYKSDKEFADFLGISPATLSSWVRRNSFDIDLVYAKCKDIDGNWLLSGEGNMLRQQNVNIPKIDTDKLDSNLQEVNALEKKYNDDGVSRSEFLLRTDRILHNQIIPLYDIQASAGFISLFQLDHIAPTDYISVPNLPKVDGAIFAVGDSMYPLIKSRDILFFKKINNILENLFFGEMYIVDLYNDGDEYTTVKFIQSSEKGPDWIKLVSQNPHHGSKDVHLSWVRAAAFVKATLRINSMS
ncbi:LexA family transcriptional regulator [Sphingobacterium thalpophilum]|uniref:LexA family transcriptional regulator n=1 Tax=Sphingobacterium thalpophilum TaxID=259 RepID=UPI0024A770E0|nr:helix-turn-helix domain-containing protein [Sphingobacterium thalpophilum]